MGEVLSINSGREIGQEFERLRDLEELIFGESDDSFLDWAADARKPDSERDTDAAVIKYAGRLTGADAYGTKYTDFKTIDSEGKLEQYKTFLQQAMKYFYDRRHIDAMSRITQGVAINLLRYEAGLPNINDTKTIEKQKKSIRNRLFGEYNKREAELQKRTTEFVLGLINNPT